MIRITMIAVLAFLSCNPARADDVTDKTLCSEFVNAANAAERTLSTADLAKLRPFYLYMTGVMDGLDLGYVRAGQRGIMAPLSEDGRTGLIAAVAVRCRSNLDMTVRDSAAGVYDGIREASVTLFGDEETVKPPKWSRRKWMVPGRNP